MDEAVLDPGTAPVPQLRGPTRHRIRVSDVWRTREVARMIGIRDMKVKYKQAALGPLWLLIAPLGMLAAITIAFSGVTNVNTSGIPYVLFALCGLTVWLFIQLSLTISSQAVIANASLVRRSPLPRLALVTGSIIGNLPPFSVMLVLLVAGAALFYYMPLQALLLPLLVAWLMLFAFATMLIVAPISARFRDTVSAMPLIIQAGIFITPVGYSLEGAPANIHTLLLLNPVTGLIEAWRWCVLDLADPELTAIAISGAWTVLLLGFGWRLFGRMEVNFADYV
jgi:lipopolysaccharide transport system permease protein